MSNQYLVQIEKAFSKLREAHQLELEAMRLFYESKAKIADELCRNISVAKVTKKVTEKQVSKVVEEINNNVVGNNVIVDETGDLLDTIVNNNSIKKEFSTLPSGEQIVKVSASELNKIKNNSKILFCRDCHKRILGNPTSVGNNLFVCEQCAKKRKK